MNVHKIRQMAKRLPTVESQTVEYFDQARNSVLMQPRWLMFEGFKVYLRYRRDFRLSENQTLREVLVIANVEIPERYRRRGWFWRYCQLCAALTEDGVVIEAVRNPGLRERLRQHPAFLEFQKMSFVLQKDQYGDWPLAVE